jgi:hypothetical protein
MTAIRQSKHFGQDEWQMSSSVQINAPAGKIFQSSTARGFHGGVL